MVGPKSKQESKLADKMHPYTHFHNISCLKIRCRDAASVFTYHPYFLIALFMHLKATF